MPVKIHAMQEADCANCGVRDQSLFANLTSTDFKLIDQPIHDLAHEPHATLFAEGDRGEYVFTVRKGLVKLVRYQSDGSQRIVRLLGPGDIAGLESTAGASYESTAIAITDVHSCRIPLSVIHELGAPRELALRHSCLARVGENLQRSFVVGLDLVLRDPGCALANGQLSAVPGEHHPPRRILLGDHGVDGVGVAG